METSWTDHVRNEEVLYRVKEDGNVLCTIKRRKANWICHVLCKNCPIRHAIEGKIGETGRRGRRCKQLLNNLKGTRGYWKLNEKELRSHSVENWLRKRYCIVLYCILLRLMPPDTLQPKAYCTNSGL